jgi:endonuclease/exonuclease/phosphatase family metal-dependent hydrolase
VPEPLLTLITYNIHHGAGLDRQISLARIVGVAADSGAQVACFQEVDCRVARTRRAHQPRELARALKMKAVYGPTIKWPLGARYGNLLLTSLPLTTCHTYLLPGGVEQRGLVEARVKTSAGEVAVYCTHFGLAPDERQLQATRTAEIIAACGVPALLAGDLNEEPGGPSHDILRAAGLVSLGVTEPTFPADDPAIHIDHVYGTEGWKALDAYAIPSLASDHRPVVVELGLRPTA